MISISYVSMSFLIFLAALVPVYLLMPRVKMRQLVLLAGNLIFYVLAGGRTLLAVLLTTTLVVYAASRLIGRLYGGFEAEVQEKKLPPKEKTKLFAAYKKRAKRYLVPAVVILLGVLILGKAGRLFGLPEARGFGELRSLSFRAVMIPLGVSYYTFSAVGYLLDIYWRKAKAEKNYLLLLLAMTYFPITIQGPISRYDRLMKSFGELPAFSYERVTFGIQRMIWGFFKKLVLADRISLYTAAVFSDINEYAGIEVLLAAAGSALHLYMDFSGCMDIVCGLSQVFGIGLDENFRQPFFAKSAAEFWRRWHITLGTWFKDYVYMPIATSKWMMGRSTALRKSGKKRLAGFVSTAVPLAVVWILTGLWHGTGADYLIWGLYWGALIILESTFAPEWKKVTAFFGIREESFGHRMFQMVRTFVYFMIGRMITALGTAGSVFILFSKMFSESRLWVLFDGSIFKHGLDAKDTNVLVAGLLLVWAVSLLQTKMNIREAISRQALPLRWAVYLAGIMGVIIFGMYGPGFQASSFVYGAF